MSAQTRYHNSPRGRRRRESTTPPGRGVRHVRFGREQFRFTLHRDARRLPALNVDPWVEHVNWQRQGSKRVGELTFRRPLRGRKANEIAYGDEIRCAVSADGRPPFRPVWRLLVSTPEHQIKDGIISLALQSKLRPLEQSKTSFRFRKDKAHPRGWNAREVTLAICRRFHVPVGRIAEATHRFNKLIARSASPTDAITAAWRQERLHTGRRFDIDASTGVLEVLELREPRYMLLLGRAILDATVKHTLSGVATAVVVTSTRRKTKHRKERKIRVKVVDAARQDRYGYIVKTVDKSGLDTIAEARAYARKLLARAYKPRRQVTFTHPGIPWLDRGDALRLHVPEDDLDLVCFVSDVRHDLSAGSYTVEVTVQFADPWTASKAEAAVERKREAAAARRARRRRQRLRDQHHKKPRKAKTRSER